MALKQFLRKLRKVYFSVLHGSEQKLSVRVYTHAKFCSQNFCETLQMKFSGFFSELLKFGTRYDNRQENTSLIVFLL